MTIEFEQLHELISFLRAEGVTSYTTPQLSLVLGPKPLAISEPPLDNPSEIKQPRPGADGLTAEEQELFYGRRIDGE